MGTLSAVNLVLGKLAQSIALRNEVSIEKNAGEFSSLTRRGFGFVVSHVSRKEPGGDGAARSVGAGWSTHEAVFWWTARTIHKTKFQADRL